MARLITFLSALLVIVFACGAQAQQQFPYVAYVVEAETYLRSGPGQPYYPTDRLQPGFAVEVYRHDNDGWCAVRPTEKSFSWVPAHQVRVVSEQVGRIVSDRTIARVGSELSPARSAVQVLLKNGEQVELLDDGPVGDGRWVRIVAPAGEFRWIAAKDLSLEPPMETAPLASASPVTATSTWRSPDQEKTQLAQPLQPTVSQPQVQVQPIAKPFGHLQSSLRKDPTVTMGQPFADQAMSVVAGSPAELQLAQFQAADVPAHQPPAPTGPPRVRFQGNGGSQGEIGNRLSELQLRLSQTVVQRPGSWQFDSLKTEATSMLQQASSTPNRNELRDFLDRIARFEQVQNGRTQQPLQQPLGKQPDDKGEAAESLDDTASLLAGADESIRRRINSDLRIQPTPVGGTEKTEARYDAVGVLKPVVSRKADAPQYALVDPKGDVVSFVTPTPDLNLQPYVGRRIGVHGSRGYMSEFRRAHVTASRVSTIEKSVLR